jgi:ribosomal protein S18 acetylase RimI-like enzyme
MVENMPTRILILEALTLATCPAEFEVRIGSWVLRSSQSNVMRANTITVFGDDALDDTAFGQRLKECANWYASHGKENRFRISNHPVAMAVDRALAEYGYHQYDATSVMQIADLTAVNLSAFATTWNPLGIDVGTATQWRMTTRGEDAATAQREANAARAYGKPDAAAPINAVQTWLDGVVGSVGGSAPLSFPLPRLTHACAIYDDAQNLIASGVARTCGTHVGLFNIYTAPLHRGQGCGKAITHALLAWAQNQGATAAFLQVEADNADAIRLYERFGFGAVYSYHYRRTNRQV